MSNSRNNLNSKLLAFSGVTVTLAINPWFAYDPINLPKMFFLIISSSLLLGMSVCSLTALIKYRLTVHLISAVFLMTLIASFLTNVAPRYQQFWGAWGRSTGLLTYFGFIVILTAAILNSTNSSMTYIRAIFEKLGYFISGYTLIQLMDLDPIDWSQKLMVATLGNINFMSSFLGMTSISYLSRIILEHSAFSSKIYFFLLINLNLYLIIVSQSIQGIAVFLAGVSILITFKIRRKFSFLISSTFLLVAGISGGSMFLGTAGIGPFALLKQETVIYRLDYWTAAINMVLANPLNGVGIDSYGDFYREYRTAEAVIRTGPQRVTNTAHNIFLDIFTSAGLLSGLLFVLIMLFAGYYIFRSIKYNIFSVDFAVFSAMWFGFLVFCLISINQIGVGIWGFMFTGLVVGWNSKIDLGENVETNQSKLKINTLENSQVRALKVRNPGEFGSAKTKLEVISSVLLAFTLGATALVPNISDARFLREMKAFNLEGALEVSGAPGIQDFHKEVLMSELAKSGRAEASVGVANDLLKQNPRNWSAWVTLLTSESTSKKVKIKAGRELMRLDPKNELIKVDIEKILQMTE